MNLRRRFLIEVGVKNALVIILFLFVVVPWARNSLLTMNPSVQSSVLSMMGLLMAGAIIGAFELSYSRTNLHSSVQRYLAHTTKFFLYLGISMLMLIALWAIATTPGVYNDVIFISSCLIYASLFMHDFWEALSAADLLANQERGTQKSDAPS